MRTSFLSIFFSVSFLVAGIALFYYSGNKGVVAGITADHSVLLQDAVHVQGQDNARATIVWFADFQDEQCRQAIEAFQSIQQVYGEHVRIVERQYPITSIHKRAMIAALATSAAGAQGKFFEYAGVVCAQQGTWTAISDPVELFVSYARDVEIPDIELFRKDLLQEEYKSEILHDIQLGNSMGIRTSQAFFVNGKQENIKMLQLAAERVLSKPE